MKIRVRYGPNVVRIGNLLSVMTEWARFVDGSGGNIPDLLVRTNGWLRVDENITVQLKVSGAWGTTAMSSLTIHRVRMRRGIE